MCVCVIHMHTPVLHCIGVPGTCTCCTTGRMSTIVLGVLSYRRRRSSVSSSSISFMHQTDDCDSVFVGVSMFQQREFKTSKGKEQNPIKRRRWQQKVLESVWTSKHASRNEEYSNRCSQFSFCSFLCYQQNRSKVFSSSRRQERAPEERDQFTIKLWHLLLQTCV